MIVSVKMTITATKYIMKRIKKEMRDFMALIWASILGSLKPVTLFFIFLVCFHREVSNRMDETKNMIKGMVDTKICIGTKKRYGISLALFKVVFPSGLFVELQKSAPTSLQTNGMVVTKDATRDPRISLGTSQPILSFSQRKRG